jgi:hypothetical protein
MEARSGSDVNEKNWIKIPLFFFFGLFFFSKKKNKGKRGFDLCVKK